MINTEIELDSAHSVLDESARDVLMGQRNENQHRSLVLNVVPDRFDSRDRQYDAGLTLLKSAVPIPDFLWPVGKLCSDCVDKRQCRRLQATPYQQNSVPILEELKRKSLIRNQGEEGSCTGHALASIIDILKLRSRFGRPSGCYLGLLTEREEFDKWKESRVSSRMLYELARNLEYAPESQLGGSSLRNVLKAFYHNGACEERLSPYTSGDLSWTLSVERAKNARSTTLGSYYRLSENLLDWQAALNETGAILASAIIHDGWEKLELPNSGNPFGPNLISYNPEQCELRGGHAFAVVGYNDIGFYVMNSWGDAWGRVIEKNYTIHEGVPGIAVWRYQDWQQHVLDGWVFRLSHPATQSIGRSGGWGRNRHQLSGQNKSSEPRLSINGHYLNLGSGGLIRRGKYPCDAETFSHTAGWLNGDSSATSIKPGDKYQSIVLCFMSGTFNLQKQAEEVEALVQVFKQNGHYPVFVCWTYAEVKHLENIIDANRNTLVEHHGKEDRALQLRLDRELSEFGWLFRTRMQRKINEIIDIKVKAESPAFIAVKPLLTWAVKNSKKIHLLAHSDGSLLLTRYLEEAKKKCTHDYKVLKNNVTSYQLLAPTLNAVELKTIGDCRKRGCKVNLVTLSRDDELADRVGGYRATYPQLLQNIFTSPRSGTDESDVVGLNSGAMMKSLIGRSTVYSHTVAERDERQLLPLHFNMMNNRHLIKQILEKL